MLSIIILSLGIGFIGFAIVTILHNIPKHTKMTVSSEYDIIIIGGGPAGSVLSKRLTDHGNKRVLLIEAGDASQAELGGKEMIRSEWNTRNLTLFDVPFYWAHVAKTEKYHWNYPDVNVAKALGGCGIHNAMLYIRALPSDIERWNMKNWTWEEALESYRRMEDFDGPESSFHGINGPIRTNRMLTEKNEISERFLKACHALGIPNSSDFNAPNERFGVGYYHYNIRDGIRDSAARAFLGPVLRRKDDANFTLMLNTVVKKLELSEEGNAVVQVHVQQFSNANTHESIRVAKDGIVVLTAGAINTPKLLLLSGIGPREELERLQIPVKQNLPKVGHNLQDHPVIGIVYEKAQDTSIQTFQYAKYFSFIARAYPRDCRQHIEQYFKNQSNCADCSGLLGTPGIGAGAFLIPPGSTLPEIQLTLFPHHPDPHFTNLTSSDSILLFTVALLRPDSRDIVYLETNEYHDPARIRPVLYGEQASHLSQRDAHHLAWGVQFVRGIIASQYFEGIVEKEIVPGPQVDSYQQIYDWVHLSHYRNSHWVGSASMGTNAENGVVDHHLRVFNVQNLRIADASVIPFIPNGNVHSTVLLVASRAADFIDSDAKKQ